MFTKIRLIVSFLMLTVLLTGCASAAFAQSERLSAPSVEVEVTRTVTITGSGKVYLAPDVAYVTIGVHSEGQSAAEAVAAKNTQAQDVTDALLAKGIAKKDIRTTTFSIYSQQEYDANGNPTGKVKYIVDNSVFVTVRYIPKLGDVLDAALKAGANTISGIQFDVEDKTAALSEARKAAVNNARVKADELAEALGVSVGEVQTISESTSAGSQPLYDTGAAAPVSETASVPVQAGQMLFTVEVTIMYEIR